MATDPDIPTTYDAEGIYKIAAYYGVTCLQKKALQFLQATCNLHNITSRAFGTFANEYDEIAALYDEYFVKHWSEIKKSSEFDKVFRETQDPMESRRINTKFREMMQNYI
jgi:hypothetical protein